MGSKGLIAAPLSIKDVAAYHNDAQSSLREFFRGNSPDFVARYVGLTPKGLEEILGERLTETDLRSALILLTAIEAAFRLDYKTRCKQKLKDGLSREFRDVFKQSREKVKLEEQIFEAWKKHIPARKALISELKGAFKFRHWLAHGRPPSSKLGRKYDYPYVYDLANAVFTTLSLKIVENVR